MDVTTLAPGSTAKLSSISHVAWDDRSDVLRRIVEPHLNLCIWRRKADPFVVSALGAILRAKIPFRLDLRAPARERIEQEIRDVFPALAAMRGCAHLVDDAHLLASLFAELAGTQHPRVRLERVEDDGCALFHSDTLRMRMLCTYAGPGTQWLENSNARRDQLSSRGRGIAEANAAIVIDPSAIRSISSWHVAVFKGRHWNDVEDYSLIHRSAPVGHRGDYRIRLCIDIPDDGDC